MSTHSIDANFDTTTRCITEANTRLHPTGGGTCISGTGLLTAQTDELIRALNNAATSLQKILNESLSGTAGGCAPVSRPDPADCCHPCGNLQVDGNTITTPGGYKICVSGNAEWTITTPDGKTTRIWGDPHVAEGDGGKWDFHDNSVFSLPDGTKIYATTSGGDGATVTTGLTITTGNEHVSVTGVNTGKPEVGQVQHGAFVPQGGFSVDDVYELGGDGDDWSSWATGREVVGSEDNGKVQKFGDFLGQYSPNGATPNDWASLISSLFGSLLHQWPAGFQPNSGWMNPSATPASGRPARGGSSGYDRNRHISEMRDVFRAIGTMLSTMSGLMSLLSSLSAGRKRLLIA